MSRTGPTFLDSLEGHIRITLFLQGEGIGRVDIASSRPQLAQRLLAGRTAREAAQWAGRLYTLCGCAQRLAAEAAAEAAAGEAVSAARLAQREIEVLAEQAREHAWQLLMPATGQATPAADPTPLRLVAQAVVEEDVRAKALTRVLTEHLLGEPPERWLARDAASLRRWCQEAATAPARRLAWMLREPDTASRLPLLPALADWRTEMVSSLAEQALDDADFCARPLWQGRAAETGALARLEDDPQLSAWRADRKWGSAARLLARLVELARLPQRLVAGGAPVLRAWPLGGGVGVAGVETARGLLLHVVRLEAGRVTDYRILAPTQWNFHPAGTLAETLAAMPTGAHLLDRARAVVDSLDPCVPCQLEVRHA